MSENKHRMEREILDAVDKLGIIGWFNGSLTPALQVLVDKYPSGGHPGEDDTQQHLMAFINYLLEERFLYPYFDSSGKELRDRYARGLTPKGLRRLRELRHPVLTWVSANWFGVVVAGITASIGVASIIVNLD